MPGEMNFDLRNLTNGERLWVHRRALAQRQQDAAQARGVHTDIYQSIERDRKTDKRVEPPDAITLTVPLALRLCRRRWGAGSRGTAAAAGLGSHVALLRAETAASTDLVTFWKDKGFTGWPEG